MRLTDVPADVFEAHVAPHLSVGDAARMVVASRSLGAVAAPALRARVERAVAALARLVHSAASSAAAAAATTTHRVGDGRVRVTTEDRGGQRVVTVWVAMADSPSARVFPALVDVRGPGRVRVVRAYRPAALRASPVLGRAVAVYAKEARRE